jgi:hypothetical protein
MENSQLSVILRSFTKDEFKEFGRFVHSPYFNNRDEVTRYYEALKEFYPLFVSKKLTEENIFAKVYPKKNYSDLLMRKLNTLMIRQAMNFFAISSFKENELEFNVKMLDKLREKKLDVMFEKKSKNMNELFSGSKHNFLYLESKYKYTSILNGYYLSNNERSMVNNFQNELDEFIEYFLGVSLLMYIRLGEWGKNFSIKFDLKFYDEVINYFQKSPFKEVTIARIYYYMVMLLNNGDEKYFFELQKCRDLFAEKLSNIDDYNIGIILMQYCYKRVIKGDIEFRKHQHEITKYMLDKDLVPAGYVEPYFFTNVIRNAANIQEFDWAEKFIKDYKPRLNPDFAEEISDYSFAMLEFSKGEYEKSLKYLSKINLEMSNMKMEIKNILIMIYYELSYTEELISMIDSYRHYLARDKTLSESISQTGTLFINSISELLKIKHNEKGGSVIKLRRGIAELQVSALKDWLLKKVDELEISKKRS